MTQELVSGASFLFTCRCLAASSLTILIWDGSLMLRREIRAMHEIKSHAPRIAFACNRTSAIVMLIPWFRAMFSSVELDNTSCQKGDIAVGITYVIADALGNLSVTGRIFLLWNKNSRALHYLIVGAAITLGCTIGLIVANTDTEPGIWMSLPGFHSCITVDWHNAFLISTFVIELGFDVYAALLVFFNSMDIPRTSNSQIISLFRKQGLWILALILVLRVLNIALSVIPSQSYWVIGVVFVEPIIAILNARLIVKACEFDAKTRSGCNGFNAGREDTGPMSLRDSHHLFPAPEVVIKIPKVSSFGRHPFGNDI